MSKAGLMVKTITLFEIRNGFRRLSTYIYFALFFAIGYLTFVVAAGAFPGVDLGLGAGGKLYANSAFMLFALISSISFYGLLVVAAVMGNAAHQDFRYNTFPLVFTSPVSKMQYLGGAVSGCQCDLAVHLFQHRNRLFRGRVDSERLLSPVGRQAKQYSSMIRPDLIFHKSST